MEVRTTRLAGVKLLEPRVFADERGFFLQSFQAQEYRLALNIELDFVQDNHSYSRKGVLRGLHFQRLKAQGKLVRVVSGEVFDVVVDIRPNSPTYGQWQGLILSAQNKHQLWIPPGLAHGFLALSDGADVEYKCTDYYNPSDEGCLIWNDPTVGVVWPSTVAPLLSVKDQQGLLLADLVLDARSAGDANPSQSQLDDQS
ncbi:dTDP-4-dehydrorhamnose 3,5-epimerase [Reinekea sp.]|jgi:dTDP-4-dehydrorhamnose 3,5-epimerase|uniref:dTDP-4-dehydrorhamnose 3,5-epimerase n=1 Tax=Reinekea sp. TaxID=1970455 RepID=UPI002A82BDB5|nr:dTDP-4-dehydrorhamnose 3,5-epimerase [Reinekea sp.]